MSNRVNIVSTTSPESEELVRHYLASHSTGVLGTSDPIGNPHVAVVYYAVEDDLCLLFATKAETQKAKNMLDNYQAAFAIYDEIEQSTVQITGRVELVEDAAIRLNVIRAMSENSARISNRTFAPAEKLVAGGYEVFRLTPLVIRLGIFARPKDNDEDYYERVLFSS